MLCVCSVSLCGMFLSAKQRDPKDPDPRPFQEKSLGYSPFENGEYPSVLILGGLSGRNSRSKTNKDDGKTAKPSLLHDLTRPAISDPHSLSVHSVHSESFRNTNSGYENVTVFWHGLRFPCSHRSSLPIFGSRRSTVPGSPGPIGQDPPGRSGHRSTGTG